MSLRGQAAFTYFLECKPKTALDIGCGEGRHLRTMREAGIDAKGIKLGPLTEQERGVMWEGDYLTALWEPGSFDGLWACHVLEHQSNPGLFLKRCLRNCADDGLLAIVVPYDRQDIVGGHVMTWTEGLLIYNMIVAGFDCSEAAVLVERKELSVVMRKKSRPAVDLVHDKGDIEQLIPFFPWPTVRHGCPSRLGSIHW